MNITPSFFVTLYRSCTRISFYKELLGVPRAYSWKYLVKFQIILALALAVVVAIPMALFNAKSFVDSTYNQILTAYPDELEITITKGQYSINQDVPYTVALPAKWHTTGTLPNAVVFTSDTLVRSMNEVTALDSYVVLTETTAYFTEKEGGEVRARDVASVLNEYEEDTPMVISESLLQQLPVQQITNLWWFSKWFYVPIAALFVGIATFFVLTFWMIVKIIFYSFLIFIAYELLLQTRLTYGRVVQLSIHVLVVITLLRWLLTPFTLGLGGLVWFFVYALVMLLIGRHLDVTKTTLLHEQRVQKKVATSSVKTVQTNKRSPTNIKKVSAKKSTPKKVATKKTSKSVPKKLAKSAKNKKVPVTKLVVKPKKVIAKKTAPKAALATKPKAAVVVKKSTLKTAKQVTKPAAKKSTPQVIKKSTVAVVTKPKVVKKVTKKPTLKTVTTTKKVTKPVALKELVQPAVTKAKNGTAKVVSKSSTAKKAASKKVVKKQK